jgi:RNA polymerase sigma-70 factor, ECF subfamily
MFIRPKKKRTEFEAVALVHLDALYGAAHRLTRNPRDAEDLVQETILRAFRFWDGFQKDSNCKAWLFKILTNTFINSYQKQKRSREVLGAAMAEQEATDGVLYHENAESQRDPQDLLLNHTVSEDVVRALTSLPPEFRLAVVLCDIEGFSYKEIAEIMDCPVGTVMSRLYRGRRLLKHSLYDFAVAQGVVKRTDDAAPDAETGAGDTIDLDAYRKRRASTT